MPGLGDVLHNGFREARCLDGVQDLIEECPASQGEKRLRKTHPARLPGCEHHSHDVPHLIQSSWATEFTWPVKVDSMWSPRPIMARTRGLPRPPLRPINFFTASELFFVSSRLGGTGRRLILHDYTESYEAFSVSRNDDKTARVTMYLRWQGEVHILRVRTGSVGQ